MARIQFLASSPAVWAALVVALGCTNAPGYSPPPADIDACPAGGTLRITLWDVYATPRRPDGDVWDGVSAGTIELACNAGAQLVRNRVRDAINVELPYAGTIADRLVGEIFQEQVAGLCGLAGNWLQMSFEGPDMFALGAFENDAAWRWQTIQVEDMWAARLNTTTAGGTASWEVPCDSTGYVGILRVVDSDLAFDDDMGSIGLLLEYSDESICNGWGYYEGLDGIAGVLVRLEVFGAAQRCS